MIFDDFGKFFWYFSPLFIFPNLDNKILKKCFYLVQANLEKKYLREFMANKLNFQYPEAYEKLQKEEFGFVSESKRRIYLFCYNIFMFCGFLYAFLVLTLNYSKVTLNTLSLFSINVFCKNQNFLT